MAKKSTIYDCSLIQLPRLKATSGSISLVENGDESFPFEVKRVFYLYDIPAGETRGAHAHRECHQFLVAATGAFEVVLDDGNAKRTVFINQPFIGLHIPPGIWAHEQNFSSGSICLVLASLKYNAEDYIRDIDEFKKFKQK